MRALLAVATVLCITAAAAAPAAACPIAAPREQADDRASPWWLAFAGLAPLAFAVRLGRRAHRTSLNA